MAQKNKPRKQQEVPAATSTTKDSIRAIAGWLFLAIGVYLLIAFVSYLFTWTADQSLLDGVQNGEKALNGAGLTGNKWAHLFIGRLFGISAFIIPLFCLTLSVICLRIKKVRVLPLFFVVAYGCIVLSIACGFVFGFTKWRYLFGAGVGGTYGYRVNEWLITQLGVWGASVLIFFVTTVWLIPIIYNALCRRNARRAATVVSTGVDVTEPAVAVNTVAGSDEPVFTIEKPTEPESTQPPVPANAEIPEPLAPAFEVEHIEEEPVGGKLELYNPKLDLPHYKLPSLSLLEDYKDKLQEVPAEELARNNQKIVECLRTYGIEIEKIVASPGPTVTLYKIILKPGIRISQFTRLENDIMLSLAARGMRVIAPIPGTNMVGIEVANEKPSLVPMKTVLDSAKFKESKDELPIVLGKSISNEIFMLDLTKMPHLLVAGATGQGKSVALNAIIASLLYKMHPAYLKFVLVDPKRVELSLYSKLEKHFLAALPDSDHPIITDTKKVVHTLKSLCIEMDDRLELYNKAGVRNLKEYNTKFLDRKLNPLKGHRFMPFIVIIIDEFADLITTSGRDVETPLTRLAQMGRAAGIHLVIATQRPTTNIITGTIKANFPARIAFRVASQTDSRTIIDVGEAKQLVGRGDMLIATGNEMVRAQCAFIDTPEVERLVEFVSAQQGYTSTFELPEYVETTDGESRPDNLGPRDELFEEAARMVVQAQYGSTSMLQRKMNLGYNRAGRLMDQLESAGIVSAAEGGKPRQVLVGSLDTLNEMLGLGNE